ncbi:exodeoxyribonuclease I [unidentified bacterial endosymbiont]|uniref:exodeoxyribonuclease I n=1 Tax=unidentified bacterial endosymbiont TaxID=2355 RepID=UPI00209F272B|nr:exodeoxyribonuclease I [unidentified bacterial endosymbiont]
MNHRGSNHFYFYDYETFGQHPASDRPAQFAGVRTDAEFNPLGSPKVLYCQPPPDYLPDPNAVLITGITPQQALRQGVLEAEFARSIHQEFSQPNSCILGYNSIRFDDEITRYLFYRNFYDPYGYSWQQGNSRWDLLDVVRACYALRPDGIEWPVTAEGVPCFKLQQLTQANDIAHQQAHDALSDVYATIALAKRIQQAQPRLFDYLLQHRSKQALATLIDTSRLTPLVHISGMFKASRGCASWVVPLAWHPDQQNTVIACDLAGDIEPLLTQTSEWLQQRLYTKREALAPADAPVPLKLIHLNKCPVLAPAPLLRPADAERLGLDRHHCLKNLKSLQMAPQIREKAAAILATKPKRVTSSEVETRLYEGFFSAPDRSKIAQVPHLAPELLAALADSFQDKRLAPLLFHYRARNFPHTLDQSEQQRWAAHCQQQLEQKKAPYLQQLQQLMQIHADQPTMLALLQALLDYVHQR